MLRRQRVFARTGGLHAAAVADVDGSVAFVREDVGRHNAVDKVVGRSVLDGGLPLGDRLLLVSGRVSFEIVQKALASGVAGIVAVSAPTSLAVDLARQHGLLLVGFSRGSSMNTYAGAELIREPG
jgi:FdhD protein